MNLAFPEVAERSLDASESAFLLYKHDTAFGCTFIFPGQKRERERESERARENWRYLHSPTPTTVNNRVNSETKYRICLILFVFFTVLMRGHSLAPQWRQLLHRQVAEWRGGARPMILKGGNVQLLGPNRLQESVNMGHISIRAPFGLIRRQDVYESLAFIAH